MILAQNLTLYRSERKIFEDINLSLASGKIIILKGKNGSGKTSFLKTIINILEPTSGTIYWKGKVLSKNLYDYYNNITYIGDMTSSIRQISVYDNIKIWKKISISNVNDKQIDKLLSMLELNSFSHSKVNTLSLGMIKKLELLRLIIENKKIWILDEPFNNLDAESINMIGQTFIDHSKNNGSIIFSSHHNPQIKVDDEINL